MGQILTACFDEEGSGRSPLYYPEETQKSVVNYNKSRMHTYPHHLMPGIEYPVLFRRTNLERDFELAVLFDGQVLYH